MTANEKALEPRWLKFVAPALVAAILLAMWQALVVTYDVPAYLVPSPLVVLRTLINDRSLLLH